MHVTLLNMFKKSVNGHIFRGKYRLVMRVSKKAMDSKVREYELQEQNMLLLRNPYLTIEQSSGHAKALNKTPLKIEKWNADKIKRSMKPHVEIEERLAHLKVTDRWE